MTSRFVAHWVVAFAITQAIEMPIYRRAMPSETRARALAIGFAASALTHPVVVLVMPALWALAFAPVRYTPGRTTIDLAFLLHAGAFFVFAEGFAVLGEAAWLRLFRVARPLRWSLIANLTSSLLGGVLTLTTGWP